MKANDYARLVEKKFSYLFKRFNFKIAYHDQDGDSRCYIGLESELLKVRFLFVKENQGSGVPMIGPLAASFYVYDNGQWIGLMPLLYYLGSKEMNWETSKSIKNDEDRTRTDLGLISERLEPLADKILMMFSSDVKINEWKPKYKEFLTSLP